MMKSFATRIDIRAPAERVWKILIDLPSWPQWNSTVERTVGTVAQSNKVTVFVKQSPGRAFPVQVIELNAPRRMVWQGGMPLGLFKGTRVYEIASPAAASTVFSMREDYTGLLAVLIGKSIPNLQPAFDEFAHCLKHAAEQSHEY